jgi:hypothetical protein
MEVVKADDQEDRHRHFHGDKREHVMFDPRPEGQKLFGACREQERNACAQGNDDNVIETPCGVAEECSDC